VDSLQDISVYLKKRLNACAPLLRLPPEVLCEIATALAFTWPAAVGCPYNRLPRHIGAPSPLGWVTLSHVCHLLRQVLLGHRALWAGSVGSLESEAQMQCLSRAGCCPLLLDVARKYDLDQSFIVFQERFPLAMQNVSNARQIRLFDGAQWYDSCKEMCPAVLLGRDLPFLEVLDVSFVGGKLSVSDFFELPPMRAPRLQRLRLRGYYVPFNGSALTHLVLRFGPCAMVRHTLPSPSQFLDMLRPCARLQTLILVLCIPNITRANEPTILLAYLTRLQVYSTISRGLALCSHLVFPAVQAFEFVSDDPFPDLDTTRPELQTTKLTIHELEPLLYRVCRFPIQNLTVSRQGIEFEPVDPGGVREVNMNHVVYPPSTVRPSQAAVCLHFRSASCFGSEFIRSALALDLGAHLQSLNLKVGDKEDWYRAVLRPFVSLRTLHIPQLDAGPPPLSSELWSALTVSTSDITPLLPGLRRLWIYTFVLVEDTAAEEDRLPCSSASAAFLQMLASRKAAGVALERLDIDMLIIKEDLADMALQRLREMVPHVKCASTCFI
jgi:hypothetical protein